MPEAQAEADRWLRAAVDDLRAAEHLTGGAFYAAACFHAQQAAEKAVKALHYARGARAVLGHNIRALIEELDPAVAELAALTDAARELDLFYVPTRYPNGLAAGSPGESFSETQARRASDLATVLLAAAEEAARQ